MRELTEDGFKLVFNDGSRTKTNFKPESFGLLEFHDFEMFSKKSEILQAKDATKNLLVTGETGSGKSVGIVLPAIKSLIENDCPGLILDIKSDLYSPIYTLAKQAGMADRLKIVGTHSFCHPINLFASIKTVEQLKNVLHTLKPYGSDQNQYWFYSGVNDITDIVTVDKWFKEEVLKTEYRFDVAEIYDFINMPELTKRVIDQADSCSTNYEIKSLIEKIINEPFSLYPKDENYGDSDIQQQKMWRSGQLLNILRPFTTEPFYTNLFNPSSTETVHDYIYKNNNVLVLSVPLEHETSGHFVAKMLRELFFKAVTQNEIDDLDNYKIGIEHDRYTFLVIDEYQFYINTQSNDGVITDENWLSISRGFGNINIFATQSHSSLRAKANNQFSIDTLIQNFANHIILKTSDKSTCEFADFLTRHLIPHGFATAYSSMNRRIGMAKFSNGTKNKIYIFDAQKSKASTYITSAEFKQLKASDRKELKEQTHKINKNDSESKFIIYSDHRKVIFSDGTSTRTDEFKDSIVVQRIDALFRRQGLFWNMSGTQYSLTPGNLDFNKDIESQINKAISEIKELDSTIKNNKSWRLYDGNAYDLICNDSFTKKDCRAFLLELENLGYFVKGSHTSLKTLFITDTKTNSAEIFNANFITERKSNTHESIDIEAAYQALLTTNEDSDDQTKSLIDKIKSAHLIVIGSNGRFTSEETKKYFHETQMAQSILKINRSALFIFSKPDTTKKYNTDLISVGHGNTLAEDAERASQIINQMQDSIIELIHHYKKYDRPPVGEKVIRKQSEQPYNGHNKNTALELINDISSISNYEKKPSFLRIDKKLMAIWNSYVAACKMEKHIKGD